MPIEALVVKPVEPWSEDDELAFQMGDMHGEAFTSMVLKDYRYVDKFADEVVGEISRRLG